jgi:TonB family protein
VWAQSTTDSAATTEGSSNEQRIERARALAAAHQLDSAVSEFESIRTATKDDSIRNVTSVMLMVIYLEQANYVRAELLLEETFQLLSSQKDASISNYFALAGQAVNGARLHLSRYRSFGINVSDPGLPEAALTDLNRLRSLLERIVAQAREIAGKNKRAYDALALLEDVIGIRTSLARDSEDHDKWKGEYAAARELLALSQTQIASIPSGVGVLVNEPLSSAKNIPGNKPSASGPESKGAFNQQKSVSTKDSAKTKTGAGDPNDSAFEQIGTASRSKPEEPAESRSKKNANEKQTISTGSLNERATKKVIPNYPPNAKAAGVTGFVRVYVNVDENGNVVAISRSEGPALLQTAAEEAARRWKFPLTIVEHRPVRLSGYIDFNFP